MSDYERIELELAIIMTQLMKRAVQKVREQQLGEAFKDLPTSPPLAPTGDEK
jgi:hypothetical protein